MKKILLALSIVVIISAAGTWYLNSVFLPQKIKSAVVGVLERQTHKKVTLGQLRFNLFKGIVLKDVVIYDGTRVIASVEETDCSFLIWPFFKKQLIIPSVRVKSPRIYLELRSDNTLNISDFFGNKNKQPSAKESNLNIFIGKFRVSEGSIDFVDNFNTKQFSKTISGINLSANFSFPANVKFLLTANVPGSSLMKVSASGIYRIAEQKLISKITVEDFSPADFSDYYTGLGIAAVKGRVNFEVNIELAEKILDANFKARVAELSFKKDKLSFGIDSQATAQLRYNLNDKQIIYSGEIDIDSMDILGATKASPIKNINGAVFFDDSGFNAENITANIFNTQIKAKVKLSDFHNPVVSGTASANLELKALKTILKENFAFSFPAETDGQADIAFNFSTGIQSNVKPQFNGVIAVSEADLKFENIKQPFKEIKAKIDFTQDAIKWSDAVFNYSGKYYKTSGNIVNFKKPDIMLQLSSEDITLKSLFTINKKNINITECNGKYLSSTFFLTGNADISNSANTYLDFYGDLVIDLRDLRQVFPKNKENLGKLDPSGTISLKGGFKGNLKDVKSCQIKANLASPTVSFYGFKATDLLMEYVQSDGMANIAYLGGSFYGGKLDASARINLTESDMPFSAKGNLINVNLKQLKLDTAMKKDDISGTLNGKVKLDGSIGKLADLTGEGEVVVTDGKLWQLDLFKGMGKLLFSSDFTNVVFKEGDMGFVLRDKHISTDNLKLSSELADINGSLKLGFDNSIEGAFNVRISPDVPLTGTLKDIATGIIGQATKFAVIRISGTLKEPKYKFQPAVGDIIDSVKNIFWKKAE